LGKENIFLDDQSFDTPCRASIVGAMSAADGPIPLLGLVHRILGFQVGFQKFQGY